MNCEHDLSERETACADGYCPLCLRAEVERLQARVDEAVECCTIKDNRNLRLEAEVKRLRGALAVCVLALTDKRIGTIDYMEGDQIYADLRNAAVIGNAALAAGVKP